VNRVNVCEYGSSIQTSLAQANLIETLSNTCTHEREIQHKVFYDRHAGILEIRDHIFWEGRDKALRREREVTARLCWDDAQKDELLFADYDNDAPPFRETFYKVQQFVQNMAIDFNGKMLALHGVDFMACRRTEFIDCHG